MYFVELCDMFKDLGIDEGRNGATRDSDTRQALWDDPWTDLHRWNILSKRPSRDSRARPSPRREIGQGASLCGRRNLRGGLYV